MVDNINFQAIMLKILFAASLFFLPARSFAQAPEPSVRDLSSPELFSAFLGELRAKAAEEAARKKQPPPEEAKNFRRRVVPAFNRATGSGLTWTSFMMLHPDKAAAVFTEEISISSSSAEAYLKRGTAYKNMRRYAEAVEDLTVSTSLDRGLEKGYALYQRALVRRLLARQASGGAREAYNADAFLDFGERLALDPEDAYSYQGRGEIRFETGQFKEAAADYAKFFDLCPEKSYADLVARGDVCRELTLKNMAPKGCRPKKFFEKISQ
jgi:tetratricopeptide (TPR) repeat protein